MVRFAVIEDVPEILDMLRASAADQGFPDGVVVTEQDLIEDGFGAAPPRFYALIAEVDRRAAGIALFFVTYSTWGSRHVLYLEDLYVRGEFRRFGVARRLMAELGRIALERRCGKLQWVVHSDNAAAVRFYESLGARTLEDWRLMSSKPPDMIS
jgi:GNAT superfamily N-acetyltransferase